VSDRLPAHLEVAGIIRAVEGAGGFAAVVAKGERDAGTLLLICCERGTQARAIERMPQPDGSRAWTSARVQDSENPADFWEYIERRKNQDRDLWIVELDVARPERFIP
jgi:hypothetical protein